MRHARIAAGDAQAFTEALMALAVEFTRLPRGGEVVFGLIAGVYPTAGASLAPSRPREVR